MSALSDAFLNRRRGVRLYDCIRIAHPNFTRTYWMIRNKVGGISIPIDSVPQFFEYVPLTLTEQAQRANLDYGVQIYIGDVGKIIPNEVAAIEAADGFGICPVVTAWLFRSDTLGLVMGPGDLEVTSFPIKPGGTTFVAQAASLNVNRTGELYLESSFPMLAGVR